MGISRLREFLAACIKPGELEGGKTLGIDASGWLFKGLLQCSEAYQLRHGPVTKYLDYFCRMLLLLKNRGVTPYVVFDGKRVKAKEVTHAKRQADVSKRTDVALREFNANPSDPNVRKRYFDCITRPDFRATSNVIRLLQIMNVSYIVAPFEADAQLAWLYRNGVIDGVITSDSDLIVHGCDRVYFDVDIATGACLEYNSAHLSSVIRGGDSSHAVLETMAIVSGCDYTIGVHRQGLKTMHALFEKNGCDLGRTMHALWDKVRASKEPAKPRKPRASKKQLTTAVSEPSDALVAAPVEADKEPADPRTLHQVQAECRMAKFTFRHQLAFDLTLKLVPNTPIADDADWTAEELANFTPMSGHVPQNDLKYLNAWSRGLVDLRTNKVPVIENLEQMTDDERAHYDREFGDETMGTDDWYSDICAFLEEPHDNGTVADRLAREFPPRRPVISYNDYLPDDSELIDMLDQVIASRAKKRSRQGLDDSELQSFEPPAKIANVQE